MNVLGNSMVGQDDFGATACIASNYMLNDIMTGCMIFNGKTFATMPGGAITDMVTSTVSWAGGTNAIIFETDSTALPSICVFPPPIAPPVAAPVATPIAAPVAAPVATPVVPPIATPLSPPSTGGNTSFIAIIIGALLSIAGAIITVAFCIW